MAGAVEEQFLRGNGRPVEMRGRNQERHGIRQVMDRLLCGDVGYGKTEVAIRAIFKAAMDGKQVAYLVPTTVLAQQHYNNFIERFKDFPVAVDVISRFRTKSEQKRILKDVKSGGVDVLIGTHRLLQKDIHFKNLGLLVIDEGTVSGIPQGTPEKSCAGRGCADTDRYPYSPHAAHVAYRYQGYKHYRRSAGRKIPRTDIRDGIQQGCHKGRNHQGAWKKGTGILPV